MMETHDGNRPKLLVHVCCGPCSTAVIERLATDHELVLYFFNPNIFPKEEYDRRLAEAEKYARDHRIPFIPATYDHEGWLAAVKGLEGEPEGGRRCAACFYFRLDAAARKACEEGTGLFTTTLTVSPHKNAGVVNAAGERAARAREGRFLAADFKKKDGFLRSCRLAKEAGMYRQEYCGCEFSARDRKD